MHDVELVRLASANVTYEWSKLLLARAHFNGTLEALGAAWQRVLDYGREDFSGGEPVDLEVECGAAPRCLRLHRRFDRHGHKIFVLADEAHERSRAGKGSGRRGPST